MAASDTFQIAVNSTTPADGAGMLMAVLGDMLGVEGGGGGGGVVAEERMGAGGGGGEELNSSFSWQPPESFTLPLTTPSFPFSKPPLPEEVVHAKRLRAVYLWVLVGVGVPANVACVLSILSMSHPPYYVAVLALADTVALGFKLLYHQIISHGALTAGVCVLFSLPAFFGCCANWVLILISLERFVAVCFPFKKQQLFTKKRIALSLVGLAVALLGLFSPTFFFYQGASASGKKCKVRVSMQGFKDGVWSAGLLSAIYFFLPFVLLSALTAIIIRRLQVIRQRRQRSQSSGRASSGVRGQGGGGPEHAVSVMLVSASLIFLVLVLPACLYHLVIKYRFDITVRQQKAQNYLIYQIVTVLTDITHAVNFFVYFLSAAKFRAAFADTLRWCCFHCGCRKAPCQRRPGVSSSVGSKSGAALTASLVKDRGGGGGPKETENCDTVL